MTRFNIERLHSQVETNAMPGTAAHPAVNFLKALDADGLHHLVAISIEGNVIGKTFAPRSWEPIVVWLKAHADRNVYYSVNEPRHDAPDTPKLRKEHIGAIRAVYADVDPKKDADIVVERDRLQQLAEGVQSGLLPASRVVDSGNGVQMLWKLAEKLPAEQHAAWAEAQSRGLAKALGGDAVQNIDRIMRLPGTTNHPTPKKLARGLTGGPVLVTHTREGVWTPETLSRQCVPIHEADLALASGPEIRAVMDQIDMDEALARNRFHDLSIDLIEHMTTARKRNPHFKALFDGDDAAAPKDASASGWRAALAAAMGRLEFDAQDYADVVCLWKPGQPSDGSDLTIRDVAREWARVGQPAAESSRPDTFFEIVTDDIDISHFPTPRLTTMPKIERRRGLPTGIEPITTPPDARTIPVRSFLIYPRLSPGTVTEYVGEPGVSKSTATIWDAIVIASGDERVLRGEGSLSPERLHRSGPVILYNAEDSRDEMQRRLTAALTFYGIAELRHPIYLWSGLDHEPITIVRREQARGAVLRADGADRLAESIEDTGAVYVALDPLAKLAVGTSENDTDDMNALTMMLARDAARLGVSIALVHHTAKHTRNNAGDQGAGRGAFSIVGGVRSVWTLTNLSADDAKDWGLPARDHVRLDHAKANHGRKLELPILLKREDATVGNGRGRDAAGAAGHPFDMSAAQMLDYEGDRAPVLRVVGVGRPVTEAANAEKRAEGRNLVAQTVLSVLDRCGTYQLSSVRDRLSQALRDAGLLRGQGRGAVDSCLQGALAGNAQVGSLAGQDVQVRLVKAGLQPTAPWVLDVETASAAVTDDGLSGLSISETDKTYKPDNTDVFD